MIKLNFLNKLKKEKKIEIVEESEQISKAYFLKSSNNLKSAKLLFQSNLYEDSVSVSYYSMYNSLLGLLFKCGIKSENHTASIMLLDYLFELKELSDIIFEAKKERIDKQYYINGEQDYKTNKDIAKNMFENSEDFILNLKVFIDKLDNETIKYIRRKFDKL